MAVKITWYSHACFLIETHQSKLLIDPFISDNPLSPQKADQIEADYILVSHGHGDHLGDTVNIASRMESQSLAGHIQVSEATYQRLKDKFVFEQRGPIEIKGKGTMVTYFLLNENQ